MPEATSHDADVTSMFELGATLLQQRWRLVRWVLIGAVISAVWAITRPPLYLASASFVSAGNDASRGGLSVLAGQFGVSLPGGSQSLSPEFYAKLLGSRELLRRAASDTFVVREMGGQRFALADLLEIPEGPAKAREEQGVKLLTNIVAASFSKTTGVVDVSVATRWPSVSLAIATELLDGVNDFNFRSRQGQATAERKFVEGRLELASAELRVAEDRLERFLATNRQYSSSPELTFQRQRLDRTVGVQQQVVTSLMQSYEDQRIREVRDTPVITIVESPNVPTQPEPRGRIKILMLGMLIGGFIGAFLALSAGMITRWRRQGGAEVDRFDDMLREVRGELWQLVRWIRLRRNADRQ